MLRNLNAMKQLPHFMYNSCHFKGLQFHVSRLQQWGRMIVVKRRVHHLHILEDKAASEVKNA